MIASLEIHYFTLVIRAEIPYSKAGMIYLPKIYRSIPVFLPGDSLNHIKSVWVVLDTKDVKKRGGECEMFR